MGNSTAINNQNNQKPHRIFTANDTWERIQNLCGTGMTQKEIGEKLHLSQSQISKIKNGDSSIDIIGTYLNIAKQLNVSLDWLLTGEEFHKEEAATQKEPDPGEPVQTGKDIDDYTVTDICKAIIVMSECTDMKITEITPNNPYNFFKGIRIDLIPKESIIPLRWGKPCFPGFGDPYEYKHSANAVAMGVLTFLSSFSYCCQSSKHEKNIFWAECLETSTPIQWNAIETIKGGKTYCVHESCSERARQEVLRQKKCNFAKFAKNPDN